MALTNATTLADYGAGIGTQGTTLKVDATNKRVGIGTTNPQGPEGSLQVGTGITFFGNTGIVSAIGGKFSGDFTVGGTLTYEDVSNIDAVGIITAQSHVSIADSILHTGDTDTSIRFPAAGTFTVSTNGTEAVRVDSSQRLLVNTDSAMETFGSAALQVATAAGGTLVLGRDDTSVSEDNGLGAIYFDTKAGGSFAESAVIAAEADANQGSSDYPSRLVFKTTADGAGSVTERVRITSAGLVGIGTDNPSALLHVENNAANAVIARFESNMGTNNSRAISLKSPVSDSSSEPFIFDTGNAYEFQCDSTSALHIKFNRNIGIGTDDPSTKLQIVGSTNATDSSGGTLGIRQKGDSTNDGITLTSSHANSARFYKDSDGKLHIFNTGANSNQFVLDNGGLAGIGTDNPSKTLTIYGASSSSFRISKSGVLAYDHTFDGSTYTIANNNGSAGIPIIIGTKTAGGESLRIDSSGRLLLGTSTSRSVGTERNLQIEGTNGANSSISVVRNSNTTGGPSINIGKSRGTSVNTDTIVQNNDTLGTINFRGADGVDLNGVSAAISAAVDGTPGSDDTPGRLIFSTTADGANTATQRMTIDSGGDVNITGSNLSVGTDSATANFTDSSTTATRYIEIGANGGGSNGDALLVTHSSGSGVGYFGYEAGGDRLVIACDAGTGNTIDFITDAGTTTGGSTDNLNGKEAKMQIDTSGNLKLGTTTLGIPSSGSPPNTFFVGRKAAIRSVTVTTTLDGSGDGTFDLGRIHYNDDESFEILLSICTSANTTLKTSFAKIYCQKVRGTGLTNFVTDTQARGTAQSGFNISSLSAGTAQGVSGHGLNINVTGGTASTEYTCTALIHVASKNNLY